MTNVEGFGDSGPKVDGRVLEERSLGMSVSSTLPAWLAGDTIHGGSRHLTKMAYEEEVLGFLEHVTRMADLTVGWVTVAVTFFPWSVVFQTYFSYPPSIPLGIAGRLRVMGPSQLALGVAFFSF